MAIPNSREQLKQRLKHQQFSVPGRRYKEAYSASVCDLISQIVDENQRLVSHTEYLEDTLKTVINQSQLAMSEVRRLSKALEKTNDTLKALESSGSYDDRAEDADLQGH